MVLSGLSVFFIALLRNSTQSLVMSCVFSAISVMGWNALDVLQVELFPTKLRWIKISTTGFSGFHTLMVGLTRVSLMHGFCFQIHRVRCVHERGQNRCCAGKCGFRAVGGCLLPCAHDTGGRTVVFWWTYHTSIAKHNHDRSAFLESFNVNSCFDDHNHCFLELFTTDQRKSFAIYIDLFCISCQTTLNYSQGY